MKKLFEEYRKDFVKNNFPKRVYLSQKEYDTLGLEEDISYDNKKSAYYKNVSMEITDEELNTFISLRMLEYTENLVQKQKKFTEIDEKINTMKGIMIFWLILTIISLIGSIYTAVKIGEVFSHLSGY